MRSSKPRKQRYFRFNAPLHERQHFVNAHLDKALRSRIGKRSVRISRGDTVKIMSGSKRGTSGKVMSVNLRTGRITLSSLTKKNAKGKEFSLSLSPSNVYITELNLDDKIRAEKLKMERKPNPPTPAEKPLQSEKQKS